MITLDCNTRMIVLSRLIVGKYCFADVVITIGTCGEYFGAMQLYAQQMSYMCCLAAEKVIFRFAYSILAFHISSQNASF